MRPFASNPTKGRKIRSARENPARKMVRPFVVSSPKGRKLELPPQFLILPPELLVGLPQIT
jgi:hypothetical protein